eukprot:CAMPEP_0117420434 /NCGR_PEP_ID=MMETSP0758-20121206/1764_1 /TAXON_ID=63605 /ORGANISM="Percolomonas cosmopolitus, Strain AE-1 (ATCC 50343)" /LENGTH=141 /DNA_ID=CAMNT_0005202031 /DNA_START=418 /DNA_END=843 /DNA_ORIENTATION=-
MVHPEGGHIYVPIHPKDKDYPGTCPYHKQCVEGMVNAKSIQERTSEDGATLPDDHDVWDQVAHYLAHLSLTILLMTSAEKIVFGGGVLKRTCLLPLIRQKFKVLLNGYVKMKVDLDNYVCLSQFREHSGLIGAIFLAKNQE